MSKASVLRRIDELSNQQADPTTSEQFYHEVIRDLAELPILVRASLIALNRVVQSNPQPWQSVEGPPGFSYELPEKAVRPLHWFYGNQILHEATEAELNQWDYDWLNKRGWPQAIARMDVGARRFRPVPLPERDSDDYIFMFGDPLGLHFPAYSIALIHTENPDEVPVWLENVVVWFVLSREFSRDSDHTDIAFAGACAQFAQAELEMLI